jgi:predicted nucleotidyltransferase
VLVEFEEGFKTFDNFMDLKYYLEDIFSRNVDLVTVNALKPQLKDVILQDVIYA